MAITAKLQADLNAIARGEQLRIEFVRSEEEDPVNTVEEVPSLTDQILARGIIEALSK